jgi:hypothetical protein
MSARTTTRAAPRTASGFMPPAYGGYLPRHYMPPAPTTASAYGEMMMPSHYANRTAASYGYAPRSAMMSPDYNYAPRTAWEWSQAWPVDPQNMTDVGYNTLRAATFGGAASAAYLGAKTLMN